MENYALFLEQKLSNTTEPNNQTPYKGLLPFRLSDANHFFGREQAIQELIHTFQDGPMTILHSESGAGKTSLLQAGLTPRLFDLNKVPVYIRLYQQDPMVKIKTEFISDLNSTPELAQVNLRGFLYQVCRILGKDKHLVIILDQFEEFLSQAKPEVQSEFSRQLAECIYDALLPVSWVLSLRKEGLTDLPNLETHIRDPFANRYQLKRFSRAEARQVIEKPAEHFGVIYEPGLIDLILDDLGKENIAPPELQLICFSLYEKAKEKNNIITQKIYHDEGGAASILGGYLTKVLNQSNLVNQEKNAARVILEALVNSNYQRIRVPKEKLISNLDEYDITPQVAQRILDILQNRWLLRVEDEGEGDIIELAHDYLVKEIQLDGEAQKRKATQELVDQELITYKRHGGYIPQERLTIIQQYQHTLYFSPEARQLIQDSLAYHKRKAKQQERIVYAPDLNQWVVVAMVGVFIFYMSGYSFLTQSIRTQEAPSGLLSLQLTGSVPAAKMILASWERNNLLGRVNYYAGLEYLFFFIYPPVMAYGCNSISKRYQGVIQRLGLYLARLQIITFVLAIGGGITLGQILDKGPTERLLQITMWGEILEAILVTLPILYLMYHPIMRIIRRR